MNKLLLESRADGKPLTLKVLKKLTVTVKVKVKTTWIDLVDVKDPPFHFEPELKSQTFEFELTISQRKFLLNRRL